ncbi:hypothetical protein GE061_005477 [Apolygus lucorum]|uniref:Uncharacterized protein n=1 Tax=Apolygus lucorum TaxID=248454 RepID=A0A8S9WVS0_APOLU|nr:hypothetical protein GE061_005477 [Apolygus lucorum]
MALEQDKRWVIVENQRVVVTGCDGNTAGAAGRDGNVDVLKHPSPTIDVCDCKLISAYSRSLISLKYVIAKYFELKYQSYQYFKVNKVNFNLKFILYCYNSHTRKVEKVCHGRR